MGGGNAGAGYSGTPLIKKLGIKPGMRVALLRMPAGVARQLTPWPEGATKCTALAPELHYVHYFAESVADLRQTMPELKSALRKDGMLWISWRKGLVDTDLGENMVREIALKIGLVDVKVCSVDEAWSGLKLVYRLKDR